MIGHGGGQVGGVEETGLCWQQYMIGQGGGQELEMEKIVVGVGIMGQGGGHCFVVVPAGVCSL